MATRPLPELEYVPYTDDDENEAIARQPQVFLPKLVARPGPPSHPAPTPVLRFLPTLSPAVSPSARTLLIMAAGVVLLASLLVLAVHSHVPPAVDAAAPTRHPALLAPEATHPAKPSAYGEAFTPAAPARKPGTQPSR